LRIVWDPAPRPHKGYGGDGSKDRTLSQVKFFSGIEVTPYPSMRSTFKHVGDGSSSQGIPEMAGIIG